MIADIGSQDSILQIGDDHEDESHYGGSAWPKVTSNIEHAASGLKDTWNSVTHGVNQKAGEAVQHAKAQATERMAERDADASSKNRKFCIYYYTLFYS